ncbi:MULTISPECIES: RNA-binding cell elongation regulator Jag/EloR [Salimicrobium]|uniref:RNA-binding protein KhpB n=2 Tax=Salimicrobium TaxID=351195 RepID=A0ABY1L0B1_9BACI|nr:MULTISPECIES: RNA-binding cell elongation regulator Jag/EloR [Salimicrobium]SDY34528.1 spoIIIJ-associated protein [Salimicrobium album]SIS91819.1 spoIIIJ-associated protein [Salimicrobium salexigens]
MKQMTATGSSVKEAVDSALAELRTTEDRVDVEILDEGRKGFLGFGAKPSIVKVTKKKDLEEETVAYIQNVAAQMGLTVSVDTKRKNREIYADISGEDIARLIGKRGQTLNALQYLTQMAVNNSAEQLMSVTLDAEGYRERRRETLKQLAERKAEQALVRQQQVKLEPMPSYERKIIHAALQRNRRVETDSAGKDPNRSVVIRPVQ